MSERLTKEHFLLAFDDPELELKVREKEPQTLDSALKYAQRLEVFRNAVRQRRQRVTRYVADSPSSRSDSLEERVVKIERGLQKPQQSRSDKPIQAHHRTNDDQSNVSEKRVRRDERNRACTTTVIMKIYAKMSCWKRLGSWN